MIRRPFEETKRRLVDQFDSAECVADDEIHGSSCYHPIEENRVGNAIQIASFGFVRFKRDNG